VVLSDAHARVHALGWDVEHQAMDRVSECNLCGGARFTTVSHEDRYGFQIATVACEACGLVFLNPRPSSAAYADFYRDTYRPLVSAFHGRVIDAATVEVEQAPYAAALERVLVPFLAGRSAGTLLDVGGSTGVVAQVIGSAFGLQATVLDPAPDELVRASERGLETVAATIESFDPCDARYDVVLLCQTLDHVLDAAGALTKLRGVLADDGFLFVDVVDFRAAYLRGWSVSGATKIDHPYYFTHDTAAALLARAGLAAAHTDHAADGLHVGYVCVPATPDPGALPPAASVRELLRELRFVQNTPR
jgi:SAM-dependent methyltransferase